MCFTLEDLRKNVEMIGSTASLADLRSWKNFKFVCLYHTTYSVDTPKEVECDIRASSECYFHKYIVFANTNKVNFYPNHTDFEAL